ncbi:hypothetical protein LWM68_22075 [Niabella sp. W65]|nr:hypothetical protein [Niabella sp. W65]MCH7365214.1 hypothetical protein [Niabella sp. W65]ULT41023.1 hypothetical protein KRR40_40980 [Niabella sp. I65]
MKKIVQEAVLRYAEEKPPLFEPSTLYQFITHFSGEFGGFRLPVQFLASFFTALIFGSFASRQKNDKQNRERPTGNL